MAAAVKQRLGHAVVFVKVRVWNVREIEWAGHSDAAVFAPDEACFDGDGNSHKENERVVIPVHLKACAA